MPYDLNMRLTVPEYAISSLNMGKNFDPLDLHVPVLYIYLTIRTLLYLMPQ